MFGTNSVGAAIGVWKRHVKDAGEKRAESLALDGAAGGQGKRAHGAAVERAVKGDQLVALGVKFRQLDGCFDGFGAGISEINALGFFARRDRTPVFRASSTMLG